MSVALDDVNSLSFLSGGGETGALMRAHDWSTSPLGAPGAWPQSLRSAVSTCLNSKAVSAIYWGPEFRLLYNDACRPLLDVRHPWALGRTMAEIGPTVWQALTASAQHVYETGEGVASENQRLVMERGDELTESFWYYSFAPIRGETGQVDGVFVTALDTTNQVLAERRLAAERERLAQMFEQAPGFMAMLEGAEHRFSLTNAACTKLLGRDVLGKTVAETLPDAVAQGYLDLLDQVYRSGEAYSSTGARLIVQPVAGGPVEERCLDFVYQPVTDADGRVAGIFVEGVDGTERMWADKRRDALLRLDERLRDVVDTADLSFAACALLGEALGAGRVGYGVFDTDAGTILIERDWSGPGLPSVAGLHRFSDYGSHLDDLRRGKPVTNADVCADPRTAANPDPLLELGVRAFLDVPVVEENRTVADMFVHSAATRSWTDEEVAFVRDFAERTRAAIARRLAEASLRESEGQQVFLLSLSDALRSLSTPSEIAWAAAERLGERFDLSRVFYAEYFGSLMRVERDYSRGVGSIAGEHDLSAFGPELLRAYHECPIVKVDDVGTDPRLNEEAKAGLRARQVGAYLDVILSEHDQWVGLLAFQSATPRKWTATEEGLFRNVGERVKSAIERARAEERLRELNETLERQVADRTAELHRFRDIVEATTSPICAFDAEYRVIAFNKAHNAEFRRVNGFDTKPGDVFPDLFIAEQQPVMRALMKRALSGESFTVEAEFGRPEFGQPLWEISYTPLRDERGAVVGAFHLATDISEKVRVAADLATAQEALRQSQKMEAMGSLTGGVAHDFNNLLTPIIGSLDMLVRKGLGSERERRLIDGALQSAERAKLLVQRLLAFARRQPLQPVAVDIGRLVDGMAGLIASTLGPTISVRVDLAPDLPPAQADPNQLEMALLNLAVNARDAMPDGGELTFAAKRESVREVHKSGVKPGHYVRLRVADNGIGMDPATRERAIEPFFSTKGIGRGTGLGLSMVHGLTAQLGGGLTVESDPGRGTSIELWLPVSAAVAGDDQPAAPAPSPRVGRGTALLVDDEELVRMTTADMLIDLGFEVVEAGSAEEALRLMAAGVAPDFLVTDHLMPGMTGAELAREARALKPALPVLVVSGYAEVEGIEREWPRLAKPFRSAELAANVAALFPAAELGPPTCRQAP